MAATSSAAQLKLAEISRAKAGPKPSLRVLQVFTGLGVGGAETWLMSLLKYFHEHGEALPVDVRLDVLLTGGRREVFDDDAAALGGRLFYVPFSRRHPIKFMREFRRILAEGKYDVIHDHQDFIAGMHFLMGLGLLPIRRIAHVHNPLYQRTNYAKGMVRRLATTSGKKLIGKLATHVVGTSRQIVSEYDFDQYESRGVEVAVANCGFDVTLYQGDRKKMHADLCQELGWSADAKVILFVGRLEADEVFSQGRVMTHKNPSLALEIGKECLRRNPDVRVVMVGAGDTKRKEFERKVSWWGLSQEIRFLGLRSDVPNLMLGSDLLLFPSLAEGLGMVVVEAQAAGLPVLASDTTPRECVVVPRLVNFKSLDDPAEAWADSALSQLDSVPVDANFCNVAVGESSFSIGRSARSLLRIYSSRPEPNTNGG